MRRLFGNAWPFANAALIFLLITAQTGAIAHSYEHELGIAQDTTCASCATASQIAAGCIDTGVVQDIKRFISGHDVGPYMPGNSNCALTVRQRGPPQSL
jgi:hypothetical protein